jgi:excisionase family DNA binding protein
MMHAQTTAEHCPERPEQASHGPRGRRSEWRSLGREAALQNALHKRSAGVPTFTIAEAAALLSVSQEHLYRLVKADAFPAVHLRSGREQGRYVIPAQAVERLLAEASTGGCLEVAGWTKTWRGGLAAATGVA